MAKENNVKVICLKDPPTRAKAARDLAKIEKRFRRFPEAEIVPFAKNTPFVEIAEEVIKDPDGAYAHPIFLFESLHTTTIGVAALSRKTKEFLEMKKDAGYRMDILSVSAGMFRDKLSVVVLLRIYGEKPAFRELYSYLGEKFDDEEEGKTGPRIVIPPGVYHTFTDEEVEQHARLVHEQDLALVSCSKDRPFLNSIGKYVKRRLSNIDERVELTYDLLSRDMQIQLNTDYDNFISIFKDCMMYVTTTEKDSYYNVLRRQLKKKDFFDVVESYIKRTFVDQCRFPIEDVPALIQKIDRALFELYIVQDLIDDPDITDVKITDPYSIRVRYHGKAYLSNITFIDAADYFRFITGVAVNNNINLNVPSQTFTDQNDENFILRFQVTSDYVTSTGYPCIHIRKVPRKKLMDKDLIKAGMFDENIRDYLLDCGKYSKGVVFAGPPGSGKTTCLNWFLEDAYESSAEILVIQENDELFAYRHGVMLEHVVLNPQHGEEPCSLEQLGQMALVAGANVFVIGEAKGSEICSAITLSNSGCRTAITIHAQSSTDTIDKMVDLALRGSRNTTYDQAKRMIRSFETIVYMEDFRIREISQIIGYDEVKKDMIYRAIYRDPEWAKR